MQLLVVLAVIAGLAFFAVGLYNGLVTTRNAYKNAFSQIDVQLQRRHDLIPNLVETAKAYLQHERETLEAVIAARNQAQGVLKAAQANPDDAQAITRLGQAETTLGAALGRLQVTMEAYPDLKANQNMMQLSEELGSTENRISFARQAFNDEVMRYNNQREQFPGNLVAGFFGFAAATPLAIDDPEARKAVKVQF
jgi:LemA protein